MAIGNKGTVKDYLIEAALVFYQFIHALILYVFDNIDDKSNLVKISWMNHENIM